MKLFFEYNGKYPKKIVLEVLRLLKTNLQVREIANNTKVPETTITNWKFGYTKIYGKKLKINDYLKKKIIIDLNERKSIPQIAKNMVYIMTMFVSLLKDYYLRKCMDK